MSPVLYPPVYTLRLQLLEIEPPIWRSVQVPGSFTLADLHDLIQLVMGWEDSHMHLFEIDGARYGFGDNEFDEDEQDDSAVLLGDLSLRQGDRFRYLYDFGDDWRHVVTVEAVRRDVPTAGWTRSSRCGSWRPKRASAGSPTASRPFGAGQAAGGRTTRGSAGRTWT